MEETSIENEKEKEKGENLKKEEEEETKISNDIIINEEKTEIIPMTYLSSLDPELFENKFIQEFKCLECGLVPSPEKSKELICCGKLFCNKCSKKFSSENKICKNCEKEEIKFRKIKSENKIIYKTLKHMIIKCPYKCEWKGHWLDLDSHLLECKYSIIYCKYKSIGCKIFDKRNKIIEHEQSNDKYHLEMALNFIRDNKIVGRPKIRFQLGESIMTTVHPHKMVYKTSLSWNCDGCRLPKGCYSGNYSFTRDVPRFRCSNCDFDLCNKCIIHYLK